MPSSEERKAGRHISSRGHITHQMCSSTFDAGDLHVRFDERDVETELWHSYFGHRQTKETATDKPNLLLPRHIPTLPNAGMSSSVGYDAAEPGEITDAYVTDLA